MGAKRYVLLQRRKSDLPYFAVIDVLRIQCQQTFCLLLFCLLPILDQPSGAACKGFEIYPKYFFASVSCPSCPECAEKQ